MAKLFTTIDDHTTNASSLVTIKAEHIPCVLKTDENIPSVDIKYKNIPCVLKTDEHIPCVLKTDENIPSVDIKYKHIPSVLKTDEYIPDIDIEVEVTTEQDNLVQVYWVPEDCCFANVVKTQLIFDEDYSEQRNDAEELPSNNDVEQTKPDDSNIPLRSIESSASNYHALYPEVMSRRSRQRIGPCRRRGGRGRGRRRGSRRVSQAGQAGSERGAVRPRAQRWRIGDPIEEVFKTDDDLWKFKDKWCKKKGSK